MVLVVFEAGSLGLRASHPFGRRGDRMDAVWGSCAGLEQGNGVPWPGVKWCPDGEWAMTVTLHLKPEEVEG